MSAPRSDGASVAFRDVAGYFLEAEWNILGDLQKELYKKVIKEIHDILLSRGYSILNPDVILKIKMEDEKYFTQLCEWEGKENINDPSMSLPVVTSVFSLHDKQELDLPFMYHPRSEMSEQIQPSATGFPNFKPDILIRFKEEGFEIEPQESEEKGNLPTMGICEELHETGTRACKSDPTVKTVKTEEPCASILLGGGEENTNTKSDDGFRNSKRMKTCSGQQRKEWNHRDPSRDSPDPSAVCGVTPSGVKKIAHKGERSNTQERNSSYHPRLVQSQGLKEGEKPFKMTDPQENLTTESHFIEQLIDQGQGMHKNNPLEDTAPLRDKSFKCSECDKCFKTKANLHLHKMTHTREKPFKCSDCDRSFIQKCSLQLHKMTHMREKVQFQCSECNKSFKKRACLRQHKKIHTEDKPFKCSECGKCFRWKQSLQLHKMTHTGDKPFKCSQCDKCFVKKERLQLHIMMHMGGKPYNCTECDKSFKWKHSLDRHKMTHTGDKPFKCSQCDKCFKWKQSLQRHKMTHMEDKSFKCPQCEKCFTKKERLQLHIMIHMGEKPFKCSECHKCFIQKGYLQKHEIIHRREKPFKCSECDKCFRWKQSLQVHEMTHRKKINHQSW